ncbi:hypothetical protein AgCh_024868 [Apium graveolens]
MIKCDFTQPKVEYLGHIISNQGFVADNKKVEATRACPTPKNVKSLRGFLGLTGYYRMFIKGYDILSKPLTLLLNKGKFSWDSEAKIAFNKLKEVMSCTPVLALPEFSKPLIIETDASKLGIGAVMMHDGQPIAYLSKDLGPKHLSLSTYEKELLEVIIATQKWRAYLLGHHFIIKMDQEAIKHITEQNITTSFTTKMVI